MRRGVLFLASLAPLLATSQAWPCSHPCEPRTLVLVAPADRQIDVPLDVEIKLVWVNATSLDAALRETNGAMVAATVTPTGWQTAWPSRTTTPIVIRPSAPLEPETTYEVLGGESVAGYFTTGTRTSDGPVLPPVDHAGLFTVGPSRLCSVATQAYPPVCCRPVTVQDIGFFPGVAGGPITRTFRIREGDTIVASNLEGYEPGVVNCEATSFDCPRDRSPRWEIGPGVHRLTVEAIDLAGRVSEPVTATVVGECSPIEPDTADAGTATDPPDAGAGAPTPDARSGGESDGGCSCRASGSAASNGALVLALLGLVASHLRRGRRRRGARSRRRAR